MNDFWSTFSSRNDLSGHSLMNLETDSKKALLKFKEEDLSKIPNLKLAK